MLRRVYRGVQQFSLPAPRVVVVPMLWAFISGRAIFHFFKRTLICEPLFKAYCTQYGKKLTTGVFIHYIQGRGELIVGDEVTIVGKIGINFAARFCPRPKLTIGSHTKISNRCSFTVGKSISVGSHCLFASDVWVFDSSGHPADPTERMAGLPPRADTVLPVVIGNNVWIGRRSLIHPGVTIGDNSIVAAGSVVTGDVPPNTVVAGNPARRFASLTAPQVASDDSLTKSMAAGERTAAVAQTVS
jgi:acetyltransferase-like isoleucine patch superfamily enzyme